MSRIAKSPVAIPKGVEVKVDGRWVSVKGPKGQLDFDVHPLVDVSQEDDQLRFETSANSTFARAMSGTMRSLVSNMVMGVSMGFEKKLTIVGVGYRAAVQGKNLNVTAGFSNPVVYPIPEGITIETPSQTEVVVKGADKQKVGQVAAEIRAFRPPEPYKGKGIRYADEHVARKEAKKK
ncbi:MAG: 50S ribosomal protein L6 [Acidiferrobacterales bacterium]